MADEPRRSGRATKGQHTKIQDEPTDTPPAKAKGKGKKKQTQEQEEEEEEEDEQIRCLCNIGEEEDDGGRAFTCCDSCNVWQHNDCMGLPLKFNPEKYFCEQCKPEDHPRIIEALKSGQSSEDIAAQNREEVHSRKKGGRKSKGPRPSDVKEEPTPVATATPEQNKRKHTSETPSVQPSKLRKASTQAAEDVSGAAKGGRLQATESLKLADNISDIKSNGRQNTAQALKKKFAQVIKEQSSKGAYRIPDGHTSDSLGEKQALVVEYSMHLNLCGTSADPNAAYKDQFRIITSNISPNPSLVLDLVNGKLTADALSTMSSNEMATDEQKKRDKEIQAENERLAMIKDDGSDRRRIRKTHKGEEYVDDEPMGNDNAPNFPPPASRPVDNNDSQAASPGAEQPRPSRISTDGSTFGGQQSPLSPGAHRRASSNFDIKNVWSNVQSPAGDVQSSSRYQPQSNFSHPPRQHSHQNDADIDRLLDDDEGPDSAPYSPTDAGTDPNIIWRGKVDMPSQPRSIACFDARAYHVAGSNLDSRDKLVAIFPRELALGGRIAANTADEYLANLAPSRSIDVTVLDLVPSANDAKGQAEFNKLFDYFLMRQRYGVVREPHNPPVRDVYVIPLEAGTAAKPTFLQMLAQNIVEDDRSRRMLLIVFVLRYNTPAPSAQATPTAIPAPTSAMSPTAPGGSLPAQTGVTARAAPQSAAPSAVPQASANGQPPVPQSYSSGPVQQQPLPDNPYTPSAMAQPSYPTNQPPPPYQLQSAPPPNPGQPAVQPPPQPLSAESSSLARNILGPHFGCATAQQLLVSMSSDPDMLHQLRRVLDNHPEARSDFKVFSDVVSSRHSGPGGTGGS